MAKRVPESLPDRLVRDLLRGRARRFGRAALGIWQRRFGRVDSYQNLAVFSAPRGGSTWLAEMLVGLGGYTMIWEPMHFDDVDARAAGIEWPNYVPPDDRDPRKLAYAQALFAGDLLERRVLVHEFKARELLRLRGYVIKFVDGNLALNWLCATQRIRAVLLVRHPCAVVLSQHLHRSWKDFSLANAQLPRTLEERYPHLAELRGSLKDRLEALAFVWAVQHWVALREAASPLPYTLLSYEELREQPQAGLTCLLERIGEPLSQLAKINAARPSLTATDSSTLASGEGGARGWQGAFTPAEIEQIMSVVQRAGIEIYDGRSDAPNWRTPGRGLEHIHPSWSLAR